MVNQKYSLINLPDVYDRKSLIKDTIAGLTVFVMLVPQGMAYAVLAGLPPVMGLYAATIPLLIYALFASSRQLAVGPVAIVSLLVFSGASGYADPGTDEYISLVLLLSLMVGIIQLTLGLIKAGFVVKFISHGVLSGFTSAAAIVIGLSQLEHFFGIEMSNHEYTHLLVFELIQKLNEVHFVTLAVGSMSIVALFFMKKINNKIPASLLIVVISIVIVSVFRLDQTGLEIVGDVTQGLPSFSAPMFHFGSIQLLFPLALTIALIAFMESIAIAKALARRGKYRVDPNKELKALGLSNVVGSFFASYPVTGSFSRSAVNYQSGAVSQISSIITVVSILLTLLFFTPYFYYLPYAVLSVIIIFAVSGLIDVNEVKHLFKVKPEDGWVWIVTFGITLFVGIKWGIIVGVIFSLLLLLNRSSRPNVAELGFIETEKAYRDLDNHPSGKRFEKTTIVRIDSSLNFFNINYIEEEINRIYINNPDINWFILDMSGVNNIDTHAIDKLKEIIEYHNEENSLTLLFVHTKENVRKLVKTIDSDKLDTKKLFYVDLQQLFKDKQIKLSDS